MKAMTRTEVSQCVVAPSDGDSDACSIKPHSHCKDNPGSFDCECNPGYENDESLNQCFDIDECAMQIHECPGNSICINLSSKLVVQRLKTRLDIVGARLRFTDSDSLHPPCLTPPCQPCDSYCSPTLHLTANCPTSSRESTIITGEYVSVGGYKGRIIYQKTKKDDNGNRWSMFYNISKREWRLKYQKNDVIVGQTSFGSNIENCISKPGQYYFESISDQKLSLSYRVVKFN